ncbi:MAG: MATE family efflux transporter [Clostridia bacterium]|nr:MATE family efflux transporter [Clostridia bacterium]
MLKDREFFSLLIKVATPIALQNLLMSFLNMVDTVMIGSLGDLSVAAVGLGNQVFFILSLVVFGIASGTSVFVAQFFGKRDYDSLKKPIAYSVVMCVVVSVVFNVLALLFPENCLALFTNDPEVIALGADYLKIAAFCYPMFGISFCFAVALRSTEKAHVPLIITAAALVVNTVLNYCLIFGKLGFAPLGVKGAAIATLVARFTEVIVFIVYIYAKKNIVALKPKDFKLDKHFLRKYILKVLPVIGNETMWGLGISVYNAVFGRIGREVVAANQIVKNIEQILTSLCIGVGSAAAVMVGKKIGEGDKTGTWIYSKRLVLISTGLGAVVGVVLILLSNVVLMPYKISPLAMTYAWQFLLVISIAMPFKMFNYVNIVGVLRGGGDTLYCFVLDMCAVWFIGVPAVYLTGLWLGLPVIFVIIALNSEEVLKGIVGFKRYKSKKWIHDLVN